MTDGSGRIGRASTELGPREQERIEHQPTESLAAYKHYKQGRAQLLDHWERLGRKRLELAIENLREAVEADSTFAEAHAWLGVAYDRMRRHGDQDRWLDSATVAVERARGLEPDLATVHVARAAIAEGEPGTSARLDALRRALELQPSHGLARSEFSDELERRGRYVEAVRAAHVAVQLAPREPLVLQEMADQLIAASLYEPADAWNRHVLAIKGGSYQAVVGLAVADRLRGRPGQAARTVRDFLEQRNGSPPAQALLFGARTELHADRPERAKAYLRRIPSALHESRPERLSGRPEQVPLPQDYRLALGLAEVRLGHTARGRELLQAVADTLGGRLNEAEDPPSRMQFQLAEALAVLGQKDQALHHLERTKKVGVKQVGAPLVLISPFFDGLGSDFRFQKIIDRVQAKREAARQEILGMDLDLYPPGAKPDTAS